MYIMSNDNPEELYLQQLRIEKKEDVNKSLEKVFRVMEKEQKAYFKGILTTQSPSRVKNLLQIIHLYRRNIINQFLYPFSFLDNFPWQSLSLF